MDKTGRLAKRVPGFRGYADAHALETDWLLRRFLAGEVEKVRDRLAEFLAGIDAVTPGLHDRLAAALRRLARFKDDLTPGEDEKSGREPPERAVQERLLDLDLALDDRIAALHTPLDALTGDDDPEARRLALRLLEEGVDEAEALLQRRQELLDAGKIPG